MFASSEKAFVKKKSSKKSKKTSGNNTSFDKHDPAIEPKDLFSWMISPTSHDDFMQNNWEKEPLHISRTDRSYYEGWFSKEDFDRLLRTSFIKFGVNLDVVKYEDGERKTLTPVGRAYPSTVWDFFEDGCSLRLLNPQTFCEPVWRMLSVFQEFFTCGMGANIYLTPANTQGFAPHFDDIEAFVLQLEGSKRWKVYKPISDLPRYSSRNLNEEELSEPVLDVVLHPGDILYFPRGWIHQAQATDTYSLHITLSTYQNNNWGTLFEKLMPMALKHAFDNNVEFRKGLPVGHLDYMGSAKVADGNAVLREEFEQKFFSLWEDLGEFCALDEAVDLIGVKYLEDCYRPVLSEKELQQTSAAGISNTERDIHKDRDLSDFDHTIDANTKVCLVRKNIARLVRGEETLILYHCLENGRVYHEEKPQELPFPFDAEEILLPFLNAYPRPVVVGKVVGDLDDCIDIATALYDYGILKKVP